MPDEEILTMEPIEDEQPQGRASFLTPERARFAFLGLAGLAGVALLLAILAIALAPKGAVTILVVSLVILALVVVAEIVLLLLARPRTA